MGDALGHCLRRMERLVEALDEAKDPRARALARELLESCLDLHGLALARILTIAQSGAAGVDMVARLVADDTVAAALLLHGLHPEEPAARLTREIAALREKWSAEIELLEITHAVARVGLRLPDRLPDGCDRMTARREIEQALTAAAPDLDRILVEDRTPFVVASLCGA
jgi:hypothetical protein